MIKFIPFFGVAALLFALFKASVVNNQAPGNERMQEIAGAISEGAHAILFAE